jgi:ribosomal protein L40E
VNCPSCGALNPAAAEWCGQCLTSLRPSPPAPDAHGSGTPPAIPDVVRPSDPLFGGHAPPAPAPAAEPASDPAPAEEAAADRGFRTVDGDVEWRCRQCGQWNPLLLRTCACGAHLGQEAGEPDPVEVQARMARTRRLMWGVAIAVGAFAVIGVLIVVIMAQSAG